MHEDTNKKTRCPKNNIFTAAEVATLAGVSESYVKKVRTNSPVIDLASERSMRIIEIDQIASDTKSLLFEEIKKAVNL